MLTDEQCADAEYLRNADKISWVKSFKDVYQKFVHSYQQVQQNYQASTGQSPAIEESELDMPCFYLRNQATIALFRMDGTTGEPLAEVVPSLPLSKLIKDKSSLRYSVQNIYDEEEGD